MTIRLVEMQEIPFEDPRLGRHVVHDPKSWDFQEEIPMQVQKIARQRKIQHRRYDPTPEPRQRIGNCTFVAECMMGNVKNNRVDNVVLDMDVAIDGYSLATRLDPFTGTYPPTDTGSSGLAAAKAACQMGIGERYDWYFSFETLIAALQMHPVSFGGIWTNDMFNATKDKPLVRPTGGVAGGHQWLISGWDPEDKILSGECWWGKSFGVNGRFYISEADFRSIFANRGDAHWTWRKNKNA